VELVDFLQPILLSIVKYILIFGCSYLLTFLIFPFIRGLINQAGFVKPNYREEQIPAVMGLIFVTLLPLITGVNMLFSVNSSYDSMLFLFIIVGTGFMGLVDDRMGNHNSKGFKGHFLTLIKSKKLTSGGFKALFGSMIALIFSIGVALTTKSFWLPWNILINFLLVSLATNMVNLFDLRPGRAGKIYLLAFLVILAFSKNLENYFGLFLPIVAILIYYMPFDLRAEVMMGDVGSNLLGASLGMMMAWMLSDISKIVVLVIMVILQLSAEKVSFTKIIERNSLLRFIDDIGRRK
jgi:UDP-N-acetylmuramyl pentapeptide phosphotransferase/UDP-N-acetylglucosamine-1-phosphate transferase